MVIAPWRAPDGWALRSFDLAAEAPAKGEIVFLGGRGDFFEKYLELFELWQSAGWNVSGFDWRGQGGSGRTHQGNSCHIEDFADFVGDLEAGVWTGPRGRNPRTSPSAIRWAGMFCCGPRSKAG